MKSRAVYIWLYIYLGACQLILIGYKVGVLIN
jgi:hypothetical protein